MPAQAISPRATYRFQLNQTFTFAHARALVPYLAQLGVSHAYLSPILMAQPGSTHGYDTVDHTRINPELGTLDEFRALAADLRAAGIGILLDFVPNHMGVGGASNLVWLDVLKHGQASHYAHWFDMDWHSPHPGLTGKIMVPFLGLPYGEALAQGELDLRADDDGEGFSVWAHGAHRLPIRPQDEAAILSAGPTPDAAVAAFRGKKDDLESWAALDQLISRQHWRAAHYPLASDAINYRRFFINSELGGIRIDLDDVFDTAHALIFQLIEEGLVDGLRIDHVDGLWDPKDYLDRLRASSPRPLWLLVEKILAGHERLPASWPVDGTTGYEVGTLLTRVLIDPAAEPALDELYFQIVGAGAPSPAREIYRCKLRVMDNELAAERLSLARALADLARSVPHTADLGEHMLGRGLAEIIAWLKVYRTYADHDGLNDRDRRELDLALGRARGAAPAIAPGVFDFLEQVLLLTLPDTYDQAAAFKLARRIQQYSGPVMAKGLEDTALYRANRLIALNDVGGDPERFAIEPAAFHDANRDRLEREPLAMIATSTHDTKRGEDTRIRIAALSDLPAQWAETVNAIWSTLPDTLVADVGKSLVYHFLQLWLGARPMQLVEKAPDADATTALADRLVEAMLKSVREARLRADWSFPVASYEARVEELVRHCLADAQSIAAMAKLEARLTPLAMRKSLVQLVLKLTIPGIPDIYRGAELWEQSLVDPDNRRPFDFDAAARLLEHWADRPLPETILPDGSTKLVVTRTLLDLRRQHPELFISGSYEPLSLTDQRIMGFDRRLGDRHLRAIVDLGLTQPNEQTLPVEGFSELFSNRPITPPEARQRLERQGFLILLA